MHSLRLCALLPVLIAGSLAGCSRNGGGFIPAFAALEAGFLTGQACAGATFPLRIGEVKVCALLNLLLGVAPDTTAFNVKSISGPIEVRVGGVVVALGQRIAPTEDTRLNGQDVRCARLEFWATGSFVRETVIIEAAAEGAPEPGVLPVVYLQELAITVELTCANEGVDPPPPPPGPGGDGLIAFWSYRGGNSDLYTIAPADAAPLRRTIGSSLVAEVDPAISPDGTRIAFVGNRDVPGDVYELYVLTLASGAVDRLSFNADEGIDLRAPCWAPDASARIVVQVNHPTAGGIQIYDLDSPGTFSVLTQGVPDRNPCWHPDPSHPVATQIVFERNGDLYTANPLLDEMQVPQLLLNRLEDLRQPVYEWKATFRLAFASENGIAIWDGMTVTPVTTDPFHDDPAWSPDSSEFVFRGVAGAGPVLFRVLSNGTGLVEYIQAGGSSLNPDWR